MASVRKRQLPSGKTVWLAGYTDGAGARRFKQFGTRKEADAFLLKARSEVAAGVHTPDAASITVEEAGRLWLKKAERDGLEPTTVEHYEITLRLHIVPFIGGLKMSRLTTVRVNQFVDQLLDAGRSRDLARRVRVSLSSIVKVAKGSGLIAHNPVRDSDAIRIDKRDDARVEMPTRAELKTLLDGATGRLRPIVLLGLFAGLRPSEIRGLLWSDVDLKEGIVHVRRRVDIRNVFGPPKSAAGTRDIRLPPSALRELKEWRLACPIGELGLVVPNTIGKVETHSNIMNRLWGPLQVRSGISVTAPTLDADGKPALDKAGQPVMVTKHKYGLHALRHAAASLWIEQGLSAKRVQVLMGHASIQVTYDVYGYLFEARDDERAAMAAVEVGLLR